MGDRGDQYIKRWVKASDHRLWTIVSPDPGITLAYASHAEFFHNEQQEQRAVRVSLREKIVSSLKIRAKRERFSPEEVLVM